MTFSISIVPAHDRATRPHDRVVVRLVTSFKTNRGTHVPVIGPIKRNLARDPARALATAPVPCDLRRRVIDRPGDRLAIDTLPAIVRPVNGQRTIVPLGTDRRAPPTCRVTEQRTGDAIQTGDGVGRVTDTIGGDGQRPPPSRAG